MAYYSETGAPATGASLTSAEIRTEFESIKTSFALLPDHHSTAPTVRGFLSATLTNPLFVGNVSFPGTMAVTGVSTFNSAVNITGTTTVTGALSTTLGLTVNGVLNQAAGSNINSASTINLTTATGNIVHITGATPITAVTLGSGMSRTVIFDGALSLTHDATNNNLPGGATFSTAAGDTATYWSDGTTVYCIHYTKKDGTAVRVSAGATATIVSVVTLTTQTAVAGTHYILTNVAATTVTLPTTPVSGDTVVVTVTNGLTTNVIARNGQTIMGLSEDLTIDNQYATVELRFVNSSWRLV